ncbi:UNVERIFIED_ORG: Fe2+ transport system protein B [Arthrobacter sp. UYCu721]
MFGRRVHEYEDERYARHRRRLSIRRLIGVVIILTVIWGIIWMGFFSGLADPVIRTVEPFLSTAAALINDPLGIDWGGWLVGLAVIVIPHIAFLLFIFDDTGR